MRKTLATMVLSLIGAAAIAGCTSQATPHAPPTPHAQPEAITESLKPEYNAQASDIRGEMLPHTQAQLIRDSSYFIFYPKSITVYTSCLEKQVAAYSRGDIGIAPRIVDDNRLVGFAVWARRAGTGYTRMHQDILQLGRSCQPNYVPPVEAPTPQLKF